MSMHSRSLKAGCFLLGAGLLLLPLSGSTAKEAGEDGPLLNPKIDTWMEGKIVTISAENEKFTVRGTEKHFFSEYWRMIKEIHRKTEGMDLPQYQAKEAEIQLAWKERLEAAKHKDQRPEARHTFSIPPEGETVLICDQPVYSNGDSDAPRNVKLRSFEELRPGDLVMVGYEAGAEAHTAYAVLLMPHPDAQAEGTHAFIEVDAEGP